MCIRPAAQLWCVSWGPHPSAGSPGYCRTTATLDSVGLGAFSLYRTTGLLPTAQGHTTLALTQPQESLFP